MILYFLGIFNQRLKMFTKLLQKIELSSLKHENMNLYRVPKQLSKNKQNVIISKTIIQQDKLYFFFVYHKNKFKMGGGKPSKISSQTLLKNKFANLLMNNSQY